MSKQHSDQKLVQWWFIDNPELNEQRDYEEDWEMFWRDICITPEGNLNLEQIKKELSDYLMLIGQISRLHLSITDNIISKPFTAPEEVLSVHDELYEKRAAG